MRAQRLRSAASPPSAGARARRRRSARARVPLARARSTSPKARGADYWRMGARAVRGRLSRRRPGAQRFSYHFTPAGAMMEAGAHAIGCTVFPAGIGQTEQQVQAIADLRPDGYVGTPSFLKHPAREGRRDSASRCRRCARRSVGGEAFPPSLRDWLPARGIDGLPELRHRRPRPHRLRDRGARGPGARRGRDRRDRAARHRRPGARRRGRRGRRDHASTPTTR